MDEEKVSKIYKQLYHEFNQDLQGIEFLYVGEKDNQKTKASTIMPYPPKYEDFTSLVWWINKHVLELH